MPRASLCPAGRWQLREVPALRPSLSQGRKEPTFRQTLPCVAKSAHTLWLNPHNALGVGLLVPPCTDAKLRPGEEVWLACTLSWKSLGGGGEPDVSAWRDLTSRLQKGPLRWSTPKWANPNDAAGEEQQAKLSCPLDALCPCPGVPSVLPRHLGVTLSWENTVCPSSQLLVGLLQDMFWAILSFPESYNGTSHLSSHTWSVRCRHSEFCPLGGSPEEEGGGAVLPPLLIGPTAIITPPPPPPPRENL